MDEKHFLLNPETYEKNYKPVFNQKKEYNYQFVIQYLIVLPFELAFSEDCIISFREEEEIYAFSFSRKEEEKSYTAGAKSEPNEICYYETCVEMSLFTEKVYYSTKQTLSEIFDRLLNHLNYIITSYLIKTKQKDVFKISKEMLEPFCLYRHMAIPEFEAKDQGLFSLHLNIVYKKDLLDMGKQHEIVQYANVVKKKLNPFLLTEELMIDARRNLQLGFYKEAIIKAQTSIETLIRTLYKEMLVIEGFSEKEIKEKQQAGFITIVKKEFSNRIGGSWDVTNTRKEIGYWYKNCYELRNRVIHGGHYPVFFETTNGVSSAQQLREFIVKRLSRTQKFEKLVKYL